MLDKKFYYLRYLIGNLYRDITSPWLQKKVKVKNISNIFGSSFGPEGWHPIIETLKEYDLNPSINIKETTLWRYHKNFMPVSITMFLGRNINTNMKTFLYPWGNFNNGLPQSKKKQYLSRFCGPSSDEFVVDEYHRIISLYKKLKIDGYAPKKYPNSYIGGTVLKKINGDTRFIVMQGNHRTAIFAHMGYEKLKVRLISNSIKYVFEKDSADWIMVKKGYCKEPEAIQIFNLFFEQNGSHIKDIV